MLVHAELCTFLFTLQSALSTESKCETDVRASGLSVEQISAVSCGLSDLWSLGHGMLGAMAAKVGAGGGGSKQKSRGAGKAAAAGARAAQADTVDPLPTKCGAGSGSVDTENVKRAALVSRAAKSSKRKRVSRGRHGSGETDSDDEF